MRYLFTHESTWRPARQSWQHGGISFWCGHAQVQALRSVEKYLNLDALYVLGTNCVDNGPRHGLEKFLNVASSDPDTVLHYEFMQVERPQQSFQFHL